MPQRQSPIAEAAARITDAILARLSESGQAYSIPQFCQRNGFSRSKYYELPAEDRPDIMNINGVLRITPEAEDKWRRRMETKARAAERDAAA